MRHLLFGIVLLAVVACNEKLIEPPKNLIPEDQMTEILYDLALINGIRSINKTVLDTYEIETMPYLYQKYNVDSLQFVMSDQYYASIPEIYQRMYQEIESRFDAEIKVIEDARQQKNDSVKKQAERTRDSLQKQTQPKRSQTPAQI